MKEEYQGHGTNWSCCVSEIETVIGDVVPEMSEKGDVIETKMVWADCFENQKAGETVVYSISDNQELTTMVLVGNNEVEDYAELVSAYPFIQGQSKIALKITKIDEWSNLIEAVITGVTEEGYKVSFFDSRYFLHKEDYKIGETYDFFIAALGFQVDLLKEKSFKFEGQDAIDFLAKSGRKPTYNEKGEAEPYEIILDELVAYIPNGDAPYVAEFQTPINNLKTVTAFNLEFYKMNIILLRDPDVSIDLYVRADSFDEQPKAKDAIIGFLCLQGYRI